MNDFIFQKKHIFFILLTAISHLRSRSNAQEEQEEREGRESERKGGRASDWQYSNWHERGNSRGRPQAKENEADTKNKLLFLLTGSVFCLNVS